MTAAFLPAAGLVLAVGLLAAGIAAPVLAARLGAAAGRQAAARGVLSTELVELLGAAPELVVYGGDTAALGRLRAADRTLVRIAAATRSPQGWPTASAYWWRA